MSHVSLICIINFHLELHVMLHLFPYTFTISFPVSLCSRIKTINVSIIYIYILDVDRAPKIQSTTGLYGIQGEQLSLTCTIVTLKNEKVTINWKLPNPKVKFGLQILIFKNCKFCYFI